MRHSLRSSSFSLDTFLRSGMGEACFIFLTLSGGVDLLLLDAAAPEDDEATDSPALPLLPPLVFIFLDRGIGGVVVKLLFVIWLLFNPFAPPTPTPPLFVFISCGEDDDEEMSGGGTADDVRVL